MAKSRFLDDNVEIISADGNIVPNETTEVSTEETNIIPQEDITPSPEVITEVISNVINPVTPDINPIPSQTSNDQRQDYMEIIKEYENNKSIIPSRQKELTNILDSTYGQNKVPMFKMVRDADTGEISVEPKEPKKEIPKEEPKKEDTSIIKDCVKELFEKANKDLTKATIEVKVCVELCNIETDPEQKKIYQQQLNILKKEVKYQQNRKNILEGML